VQVLLIAQEMGHLQLGNVSLDGSKIHADASKSKAVSYKRLLAIEAHLQAEVNELFALAEAADGGQLPDEMNIEDEIERREQQLARLAEAKQVLEARAQARYEAEKADYEAKMQARKEKAAQKGGKPPGRPPNPPTPGPRAKDQYNFTDPESVSLHLIVVGQHQRSISCNISLDRLPRCLGGVQRGGGTLNINNSSTVH
jgi:multidrug efflux pump subunit AcrA (membrane-fusion protein)